MTASAVAAVESLNSAHRVAEWKSKQIKWKSGGCVFFPQRQAVAQPRGLTCKHGFEIVGGGGHHGAVHWKGLISIPGHQRDITE